MGAGGGAERRPSPAGSFYLNKVCAVVQNNRLFMNRGRVNKPLVKGNSPKYHPHFLLLGGGKGKGAFVYGTFT